MTLVSQKAILQLRNKLYQHTLRLDLKFFDHNRTGDLMARLTGDVNQLQELVSANSLSILADVITFVAIVGFIFYTDWNLALLTLITLPFLFATSRYFSLRIKNAYRSVRRISADVNNSLQDTLSGIRMIKSFASEDAEAEHFSALSEQHRNATVSASKLSAIFSPIIDWLNYVGMTLVLVFGAWQVMDGHMTVGDIVAYLAYLRLLQAPIRSFSRLITKLQQSAAAMAANAHEFITALPQGYETAIGERGVKLSGGQKQRLSIARAFLTNPRILILDEATAALDTESEHHIQHALSLLLPGRTCLVIAHRLSTIQNADQIVVLEQGEIVELGKHETLLRQKGRYKALYDMQFPRIPASEQYVK